jgi:hypothetical protein
MLHELWSKANWIRRFSPAIGMRRTPPTEMSSTTVEGGFRWEIPWSPVVFSRTRAKTTLAVPQWRSLVSPRKLAGGKREDAAKAVGSRPSPMVVPLVACLYTHGQRAISGHGLPTTCANHAVPYPRHPRVRYGGKYGFRWSAPHGGNGSAQDSNCLVEQGEPDEAGPRTGDS